MADHDCRHFSYLEAGARVWRRCLECGASESGRWVSLRDRLPCTCCGKGLARRVSREARLCGTCREPATLAYLCNCGRPIARRTVLR